MHLNNFPYDVNWTTIERTSSFHSSNFQCEINQFVFFPFSYYGRSIGLSVNNSLWNEMFFEYNSLKNSFALVLIYSLFSPSHLCRAPNIFSVPFFCVNERGRERDWEREIKRKWRFVSLIAYCFEHGFLWNSKVTHQIVFSVFVLFG